MPGSLDRQPQGSLVFGADSGTAPGFYLRPVGYKPANTVHVLVVDGFHVVNAERTYLPAGRVSSAGASTAGTSTRTPAGTAWATRPGRTPARPPIWWGPSRGSGGGWAWRFCGHISPIPLIKSCNKFLLPRTVGRQHRPWVGLHRPSRGRGLARSRSLPLPSQLPGSKIARRSN